MDGFNTEKFFWLCAIAGSSLFALQFLLTLIGASDQEAEIDESPADAGNFKWLTRQAISGFIMMFGWAALSCKKEWHFGDLISAGAGLCAGAITLYITGTIYKMAGKLHSSGTRYKIEDAVGKEATVYQRIPKNGVGKITVSLYDLTHEIDAVSSDGEELPSFARVQIIRKSDDKTVVIKRIPYEC